MLDEKLLERLEKIKALAERGVGGEKVTAQKKLDKLLKENGLTLDSLHSEQVNYYLFSYTNEHTMKLLSQIIYKVLGVEEGRKIYKSKNTRLKLGVYCTPAQKVEIDLDYEFYKGLFEDEVSQLLSAFIQQQDIFPQDSPIESVNLDDLSPEEKAKFMKQQAYKKNMTKQTRRTMIEKNP